jgi:hypothetical protein
MYKRLCEKVYSGINTGARVQAATRVRCIAALARAVLFLSRNRAVGLSQKQAGDQPHCELVSGSFDMYVAITRMKIFTRTI